MRKNQREILKLVCKGNPDGSFLDLDQLLERLSYEPTKQALAFSIRFMIRRKWIEKRDLEERRGAKRRIIAPTLEGYNEFREIIRQERIRADKS